MQVNPCLFIGIGSTGKDVLNEVRRLCYEEYGMGGLPCFRYVVLETDGGAQKPGDDSFLAPDSKDYERCKFVPITIEDVGALKQKLVPGAANEVKGVMDWLDPRVLDLGAVAWTAGAGAHRQIGRLCLYNHWSRVDSAISEAWGALHQPRASSETDEFLRKTYFPTKKVSRDIPPINLVSDRVRVFICGTLCGGTCSGTFLDVAYAVRRLLNNRTQEIIGVFALPPIANALGATEKGRVANAWVALKELDYYSQPGTRFCVRLPDGGEIDNADEPFNHTYLVTLANRDNRQFRLGEQGVEDLTGMCALSLFAETVPEISSVKDAIRADLRAIPGYASVNPAGRVKSFSSFGLSAIWYPRYRITRAITFALGSEMARHFIGSNMAPAKVDAQVAGDLGGFIERARGSLTGSVGGAHCIKNLLQEIQTAFANSEADFTNTENDGLAGFVASFPSTEKPYRALLANPDGEYFKLVALAEPGVRRDLKEQVLSHLDGYLQDHTVEEANRYCETLIANTRSEIESISQELPQLGEWMNPTDAHDFTNDWPTRLVGLGSRATLEYKQYLWNEFRERVLHSVNQIRDHFLRVVLDKTLQDFRVKLQDMSQLLNRLRILDRNCQNARTAEEEPKTSVNIFTVSRENPRDIRDDVEWALSEIRPVRPPASLKREFLEHCGLATIQRGRPEELLAQVENTFRDAGHAEASKFSISGDAIINLRPQLNLVVQTAAPYFEAFPTYVPIAVNRPSNRLFGKYDTGLATLLDAVSTHLPVGDTKFSAEATNLDHFVICYRETAGIAISDLQISGPGEIGLAERERTMPCTSYSHKLGARAFDTQASMQLNRARELASLSLKLAQGAFPGRASARYVHWQNDGIDESVCITDDQQLRDFVERQGLPIFEKLIHEVLRAPGQANFNAWVNQCLSNLGYGRERDELQQKFLALRQAVFTQGTASP